MQDSGPLRLFGAGTHPITVLEITPPIELHIMLKIHATEEVRMAGVQAGILINAEQPR